MVLGLLIASREKLRLSYHAQQEDESETPFY
jgi:hypothetical protein